MYACTCLPDWMFWVLILTNWSRSGLLCSCHLPKAWNISWITMPLNSHPWPMEISWGPLTRPMKEKHLQCIYEPWQMLMLISTYDWLWLLGIFDSKFWQSASSSHENLIIYKSKSFVWDPISSHIVVPYTMIIDIIYATIVTIKAWIIYYQDCICSCMQAHPCPLKNRT